MKDALITCSSCHARNQFSDAELEEAGVWRVFLYNGNFIILSSYLEEVKEGLYQAKTLDKKKDLTCRYCNSIIDPYNHRKDLMIIREKNENGEDKNE